MITARINGIWHGDILDYRKMDRPCDIDILDLTRAPRLNLEVQYDTRDFPKRALMVIKSEFDGSGEDNDVTNIPADKTAGVLDTSCLDIPKGNQYRTLGSHTVNVKVFITSDTVIWRFIRALTFAKVDKRLFQNQMTFAYRVTGQMPSE